MKNLFYLSLVIAITMLSACSHDSYNDGRNYRYAGIKTGASCSDTLIKDEPKPVPAQHVRYQPTVIAQNCGGCPAKEYTVRTPVKVVYKTTTYRTVYEPRTFETTTYETRPYNRVEACSNGNCMNGGNIVVRPTTSQENVVVEEAVIEK